MQKTPEFGEDIKMNEGINPLRIAVIGCGNRGRGHMRIVHSFGASQEDIADCFDFLRGNAACVPVYGARHAPALGFCPPAAFFRSFMCATLGCWLDFE